jgi:hypothetical protein
MNVTGVSGSLFKMFNTCAAAEAALNQAKALNLIQKIPRSVPLAEVTSSV